MIHTERTPEGFALTIRPTGVARYGGALFLGVWLCFWALGETIVLGVLLRGAWSLLQGQLHAVLPVLGVGAFMLVWVTFWTFGGVMAILELLRLLSSEDVLVVAPGDVVIRRRRGPFRFTKRIPRADVRAVRVAPRHRMLVLDTTRRSFDFAAVVSPADEHTALFELRRELGLAELREGEPVLPDGWEETVTPEGDRVLVRDTKLRRKQALALAGIAGVFWMVALAFAWAATSGTSTLGAAVLLTVVAALFAAGAWWLDAGRPELKLGGQRIVVRRRWRGRVKELFVADRLELTFKTDSDGDVWYRLEGFSNGPVDPREVRRKSKRTFASAMNDPFEPRALGRWLAARSGVPYAEIDP